LRTAAALAIALGACAPVLPAEPVPRALARDVARVVSVRQTVGWLIDDVEVQALMPDVLKSACRVDEQNRAATLAWLQGEITRLGGSPAEAWLRAGKDLDEIQDLLLMWRVRLVLGRADEWVRAGKCPFWLEPESEFKGAHVNARRWILSAAAGGRFIVGSEAGVIGYGGGGGGRVMAGYGVGERSSLVVGLEGGGGARFTNVPIGERATIPDFLATFAVPVVGRYTFGLSGFVEVEMGFMAYINQVDARIEPGARFGVAIGGMALRIDRGLLPHVAFGITVDHAPGWGDRLMVTQLSAGLRTGFDLSR
jgi:hypothetical protein